MKREMHGSIALRISPNRQEAALIIGPKTARMMLALCQWLPGFGDVSRALSSAINQMESD